MTDYRCSPRSRLPVAQDQTKRERKSNETDARVAGGHNDFWDRSTAMNVFQLGWAQHWPKS